MIRLVRFCASWRIAAFTLVVLGAVPGFAAEELKLRIFEDLVRGAYIAGDPLVSGASDVLIETAQSESLCGSQLFRWTGQSAPRAGMVVSAEQTEAGVDRSTFIINACRRALTPDIAEEISWPRCLVPEGARVHYWVGERASSAQCLVPLTTVDDATASASTASVGVWALPAVPEGTVVVSGLSELFDSSPHPRAMRNLGFKPCHSWHLATVGMPDRGDDQDLSRGHSLLSWSSYYLVDTGKPYSCEPGERSPIDLLNRHLGRLADGSAFIGGQRSVLAVKAIDGRSAADPRLRRIDPAQLVEDLRQDGGRACTEPGDEESDAACKWIRDAGQGRVPEGKAGMRLWYQAFESAVRRIYFPQRK